MAGGTREEVYICWSIWRERNIRCFEDSSNSIQKIKENCINTFYFWCIEEGTEEVNSKWIF